MIQSQTKSSRRLLLGLGQLLNKRIKRKILIFTNVLACAVLMSAFFVVFSVRAEDYTGSNFILRNPVITVSGGRSETPTFELYSSTGQIAPGESTSSKFTYQAGFLYFDTQSVVVTPPSPTPTGGGGGSYFSGK